MPGTVMFVLINSTASYWSQHLTQSLLAAHGVRSCVWHDHAATLYAGGTFLNCALAVDDEDLDAAAEVLNSPPGELPEIEADTALPISRHDLYPDTAILLACGMAFSAALDIALLLARAVAKLTASRFPPRVWSDPGLSSSEITAVFMCWLLGSLVWTASTASLLLPLRWKDDGKWSCLWAYLYGRWVFPWLVLLPLGLWTWIFQKLDLPRNPF